MRHLPVPPRLAACLHAQWEQVKMLRDDPTANWKDHGLLFPSEAGTPIQPRNFERTWSGQMIRMTLKMTHADKNKALNTVVFRAF